MHAFKSVHQKYINQTVQTRVLNVSFLYTPVRVPGGHYETKYTSVITVQVADKAGSCCARVISLVYSYSLLDEQCYKHTGYLYKLQTQGLLYKAYKEH